MRQYVDLNRNGTNIVLGEPEIGESCWIGHFTILDSANAKLKIGDRVVISSGVHIYTHESTDRYNKIVASVTIGDDVVIGANAVILPGCVIHSGAVIGACSVLPKNTTVGIGEVWGGVPAKKIKQLRMV